MDLKRTATRLQAWVLIESIMKSKIKIVSVSVAVQARDADAIAQELSDVSSNYGFYSMGTEIRNPTREERAEIESQVPEDIRTEAFEDGTSGQDRKSYTDTQDRKSYRPST